jgi:hypothetical protein
VTDIFDKMAQTITDVYNAPVVRSTGLAEYLRTEFGKLQRAKIRNCNGCHYNVYGVACPECDDYYSGFEN